MPKAGPDGRPAYLPHEAFNLIGRKVYGQEWREAFSGGEPLPDLKMAKRILARGGPEADRLRPFGDLDDSDYAIIQSRRFRENYVFRELLNALLWGKTEAYLKTEEGRWKPLSDHSWQEAPQLTNLLRCDLLAALRNLEPGSGRLLIDKAPLDAWIHNIHEPNDAAPAIAVEPNPVGRPGPNWESIRAELRRMEAGGELPEIKREWRTKTSGKLRDFYENAFPEEVARGLTPEVRTIRDKLKADFDCIEERRPEGR